MTPYARIQHSIDGGKPVVLSAPMGAELVRRGVRWRGHGMLTDRDSVRDLYVEYFESGADIVRINTFQLNRRIYLDVFRDEAHMRHIGAPDLEHRAVELSRRAVTLAHEARAQAGRGDAAIAGVMAPLEHCFRPDLSPDIVAARQEHGELAQTLADAGVDLILIESMNTLAEARAAASAATATHLPVWVSFALGPDGRLLGRELLDSAARAMRDMGAQAVLVNAIPPSDAVTAIEIIAPSGVAGVFPMIGKYDPPSWKFEYFPRFCETDAFPPEQFAHLARSWVAAGAKIVGSCGGSGPAHTRALSSALHRPSAGLESTHVSTSAQPETRNQ